jgi:Semialdehyde dehydrogenase, NAD binding domain
MTHRVGVIGAGAVGARTARQLSSTPGVEVLISSHDRSRANTVAEAMGPTVTAVDAVMPADVDAVVIATPAPQHEFAEPFLHAGVPVVTTTDDREDCWRLLSLDGLASDLGLSLVVGAGFAPGLSCLLARFATASFESVDEIHVAKHGTGGPACARQHHHALASTGQIWRDGDWRDRTGGSGRELCWFPDPVGAHDCYNAELPDPLLLLRGFPTADRLSARMSATRRDRLTSRLPMLRKPHPEGGLGGIRVEVRGVRNGQRSNEVLGAIDRPGIAAGAVAAVAAIRIALVPGKHIGAIVLSDAEIDTAAFLEDLAERGVKAARYAAGG